MEEEKAKTATEQEVTIFDKIVAKEIPASILYEDEICMAFKDAFPQTAVHFLVIPKNRGTLSKFSNAEDSHKELLGHLMVTAAKVAKEQNLEEGYRVVINNGVHGCQSVYHLHIHVLGGQ